MPPCHQEPWPQIASAYTPLAICPYLPLPPPRRPFLTSPLVSVDLEAGVWFRPPAALDAAAVPEVAVLQAENLALRKKVPMGQVKGVRKCRSRGTAPHATEIRAQLFHVGKAWWCLMDFQRDQTTTTEYQTPPCVPCAAVHHATVCTATHFLWGLS